MRDQSLFYLGDFEKQKISLGGIEPLTLGFKTQD